MGRSVQQSLLVFPLEYRINEELMKKRVWIQDAARAASVKMAVIEVSNHDRFNAAHTLQTIPADIQGIVLLDTVKPGTYNLRVVAQWHEPLSLFKVEITKTDIQFTETRIEPILFGPTGLVNAPHSMPIIRLRPVDHLTFNGKRLCWHKGSHAEQCWSAVSGREGYQSGAQQTLKDKGPLPEGRWSARQSEYQKMPDRGFMEKIAAELGRTAWPGGESAWGRHRVWLHPESGTATHGRSGFSIHGGDTPGSAGCIDLTSSAAEFAQRFENHGKDMLLDVRYGD